MKIALLATALVLFTAHQESPTKSFTEPYLGIQFNYPKTWTIEKTTTPTLSGNKVNPKRKPKIDKTRTLFLLPIDNSVNKAELEVVRTEYHASIDLWQTIQIRESEINKTQVVRQWEQDILGVPMLFSRVDSPNGRTAIVGLFYTRTSFKLLFRLTAPSTEIDKVTFEFNKMLETLKYIDGSLPKEDDPSVTLDPIGKKPQPVVPVARVIDAPSTGPKVPLKAPVTANVVVSTKPVMVRLPEGWTAENIKDNALDIKESTLSVPMHVQVFSVLDSDPAPTALIKLSAKDLNDYTKVASREDFAPKTNSAGCSVSSVWRLGQDAKGELVTGSMSGAMGDYYLLITYRTTDSKVYKADRKIIDGLLKQISIELAP